MTFKLTPVLYVLQTSTKKLVVLQGGTNSGKTYNSLYYIATDAIDNVKFVDDLGDSHNKDWMIFVSDITYSEKNGAYKDLIEIMDTYGLWEHVNKGKDGWEKKLNRIRFKSGGSIQFATTVDLAIARKGTYTRVYFPEVNSVDEVFFEDVRIRCKDKIVVDYNSDSKFYIHHLVDLDRCYKFDNDGCIEPKPSSEWKIDFHIFNYRHNIEIEPYLDKDGNFIFKRWLISKQMRDNIEDYCVKCEQTGMEKWCQKCRVLAMGLTGGIVGLVYPDVNWIDDATFEFAWENGEGHGYGCDYGYVNSGDPSVITKNVLYKGAIYSKLVMYEENLKREGWLANMQALGMGSDPIAFDSSHAKETFDYLSGYFYGLRHARRYPGGVVKGIAKVREYDLYVVDDPHYRAEQSSYKLKKLRGSYSRAVNPIDKHNHIWDSLKYWVEQLEHNELPPPPVKRGIVI